MTTSDWQDMDLTELSRQADTAAERAREAEQAGNAQAADTAWKAADVWACRVMGRERREQVAVLD